MTDQQNRNETDHQNKKKNPDRPTDRTLGRVTANKQIFKSSLIELTSCYNRIFKNYNKIIKASYVVLVYHNNELIFYKFFKMMTHSVFIIV